MDVSEQGSGTTRMPLWQRLLELQVLAGSRGGRDDGGAGSSLAGHGRHPWQRLPAPLERRLVLAAAGGDALAREELVEQFLPLIGSVARRYRSSVGVERAELMQEGVVGLLRALERFEPAMGTPFWAYASWWVRQAMQQLVAEVRRPVVLSDRALRQLARVKDARRVHVQSEGMEPSNVQLAERTGLAVDQVQRLLAIDRSPRGVEETLGNGSDDRGRTIGDTFADPAGEDEYERVISRVASDQVSELPESLSAREREILGARYGIGCDTQTLREIADGLALSAERVRQIEERALAKLRDAAAFPST
ncbi:MAG TPA: sigma-70 family RNA polymerase sigma factor [Thermoleophilaceae bacterium]|nr:sigma-70 family RNA polymerase sigma factor [Thermoleophilaceae bacterium]